MPQDSAIGSKDSQPQTADISACNENSQNVTILPKIASNSPLARFGGKLNRWKPGQSGNPRGRKPDTPLTKELRRLAKQKQEAKDFARSQFDIAQNPENPGAVSAAKLIMDRVEGPLAQDQPQGVTINIAVGFPSAQSVELPPADEDL